MDEIQQRLGVTRSDIEAFCRRWDIVRMELFGSVLRDDFDARERHRRAGDVRWTFATR